MLRGLTMNINQNINKLLYALKQKGQIYRINSFKFYSEKNDRYATKYQILKRELIPIENFVTLEDEEVEFEEKYKVDYECYSKVDLIKYLAEEYRKGSEAGGK
jgi:hypothetical protein